MRKAAAGAADKGGAPGSLAVLRGGKAQTARPRFNRQLPGARRGKSVTVNTANTHPADGNGAENGSASKRRATATGTTLPGGSRPPNPPDLGSGLLAAYRLLDAAGTWFEQLQSELADVLGRVGNASPFAFAADAENTEFEPYSAGEGWLLDGWRWGYPGRHRRKRIGELSVVVDLGRPGRPAAALGTPCLIVLWSGSARNWVPTVDAAAGFWPPLRDMVELVDSRVFRWVGSGGHDLAHNAPWMESSWFYLVPLAGLTSMAALRSHVVQPALALLNGADPALAFGNAPDVMRFRQHEGALKRIEPTHE